MRLLVVACLILALPLPAKAAHYVFDARLASDGRMTAKAVLELTPREAGEETRFFLSRRLTVTAKDAGPGADITVEPADRPLPEAQRIVVRRPGRGHEPLRLTLSWEGPLPSVSAQRVELNLEDGWLPIRDDLELMFSLDATIAGLPKGVVAVAQGQVRQRGDTVTIHRRRPDSDLTLIGAPGLKRYRSRDLEFWTAQPEDPLIALLHDQAKGSVRFYRALYGPPEFGTVRMVIVPRASTGGYARKSFIVMPTFRRPGDPPPAFDRSSPARFVSHEFSHAWLAAPAAGGENYWVSESVAEYWAMRYVEAAFGTAERDAMIERKRKASAGAGPLVGDRRPPGSALYQKGPVLLFDLEARIGRDRLDQILGVRDRPRTTRAFLDRLEAVAGREEARRFAEALSAPALDPRGS